MNFPEIKFTEIKFTEIKFTEMKLNKPQPWVAHCTLPQRNLSPLLNRFTHARVDTNGENF